MTPYYEHAGITIYHGDCREVLPTLDKVDLVLTDPPYGIGDKWTKGVMENRKGQKSRLWGKGETWDDSTPCSSLINSTIAAGTHAIVWGGNYFEVPPSRQWLIWDKIQTFTGADAEMAWTNLPGTVRCFRMARAAAFGICNGKDYKEHPTQKPIKLISWCVSQCPDEPQTILDPFMGSGTTLRAAKDLGRKAIGIEIEEKYCEIAANRLRQEVLL